MNNMIGRQFAADRGQRGVSTILIILMISLAMTVSSLGVVYVMRGDQEMQVAAHASTHSQASAMAGVEAFRRYLFELSNDLDTLADLTGTLSIQIDNVDANLSAEIVDLVVPSLETAEAAYELTVNIRSEDTAARSTSVVQAVYRVLPFLCSGGTELLATLDFQRDLELGGDVTILSESGAPTTFYVDGSINLDNVAASGVGSLVATGNISLGSGVFVPELWSNGDINLVQSANVGKASALGQVTTTGNARVDLVYANGDVTLQGGTSGDINSRSTITFSHWNGGGNLTTLGEIAVTAGSVGDLHAVGDITLASLAAVNNAFSESNISCPSGWTAFSSLEAEGTINSCSGATVTPSGSVDVNVMAELTAFDMEATRVDAWALRGQANYVFTREGDSLRVDVRNIHGINDGTYYLGSYPSSPSGALVDYLCTSVDDYNQCLTPAVPGRTICQGFTSVNGCFGYDTSSETWYVNGRNLAPGVMWFEGNLNLGNGHYYNTFVATRNLSTSDSHATDALNFAGYEVVCENAFPENATTDFAGLYPTNFCDLAGSQLENNATGNVALLAGGYNPNNGGSYEGGDISLAASSEIGGSVMAGNYFFTGGDVTIRGLVTASGLGAERAGTDNRMAGTTVIDLQNLPSTYSPALVPNMSEGAGSCSTASEDVSRTYWSRYL